MWLCLNNAFLSVVADPENINNLIVRSRKRGHIEAVFPEHWADVKRTPGRDYHYRLTTTRRRVQLAISERLLKINYTNFKDSVEDSALHDAYFNMWLVMFDYQDKERMKDENDQMRGLRRMEDRPEQPEPRDVLPQTSPSVPNPDSTGTPIHSRAANNRPKRGLFGRKR